MMMNTGLALIKSIGAQAFDDSTRQGNLSRSKAGDKTFSVGMYILRGGLVALFFMAVIYAMMCLTGYMTSLYAAADIWTVAQSMFSSVYDSIKGIAAWAAIAGAVFCLLGIFFQRDEKAVAGKIKGLIVILLAYVGIFVLPNLISTLTGIMSNAGVNDVQGLD